MGANDGSTDTVGGAEMVGSMDGGAVGIEDGSGRIGFSQRPQARGQLSFEPWYAEPQCFSGSCFTQSQDLVSWPLSNR